MVPLVQQEYQQHRCCSERALMVPLVQQEYQQHRCCSERGGKVQRCYLLVLLLLLLLLMVLQLLHAPFSCAPG
jgi:hypothetical protein